MTKLMEWLTVLGILASLWIHMLLNKLESDILARHHTLILYMPIILLFMFGLYAATTVMYRVFTFNNCEEAAKEIQMNIEEAKKDLKRLGYEFGTNPVK